MKNIKAFLLAAALLIGVQYASAAWSNPSALPPNSNTDAPLNVGDSLQQKLGSLAINTNTSNPYAVGLTVFGQVQIVDGTQGAGKILTSNANGVASWVAPAGQTCSTPAPSTTTISSALTTNSGSNGFTNVNLAPLQSQGTYTISGSGQWGSCGDGSGNIQISDSASGQVFWSVAHHGEDWTPWSISQQQFNATGGSLQLIANSSCTNGSITLTYQGPQVCSAAATGGSGSKITMLAKPTQVYPQTSPATTKDAQGWNILKSLASDGVPSDATAVYLYGDCGSHSSIVSVKGNSGESPQGAVYDIVCMSGGQNSNIGQVIMPTQRNGINLLSDFHVYGGAPLYLEGWVE